MEKNRIESTRGDRMAAHVYDCFNAGATDVAILPNPMKLYKQAIMQPE